MKRTILHPAGLLAVLLFLFSSLAWANESLKPYILVSNEAGDFSAVVDSTKNKLTEGGFTIAGEYAPYDGAHAIVVTSDELQAAASKSEFGGYGAVIRVAVTKNGDNVEVAYSNPVYWSNAYLLASDGSAIAEKMTAARGKGEPFGSAEGLTAKQL